MPTNNQSNERPRHRAAHFRTPGAARQGGGATPRRQASAVTSECRPAARPAATRGASAPAPGSTGAIGGTTSQLSARTAAATRRAGTQGTGRRHGGNGRGGGPRGIAAIVAILAGVAAFVALFLVLVLPRLTHGTDPGSVQVASGQEVEVVVPDGSSTSNIASILRDAGVISDASSFIQEVQRQNAEQKLKSGTYSLLTGSSVANVINQLVAGPNSTASTLQVPEGYTVAQIASLVEGRLGIPSSDFIAQAKASNYVADYPFLSEAAHDSLEGFLFPKTYDFAGKAVTADSVIRAMLTQYQTEVATLGLDGARQALETRYGRPFTNYDVLTMASIIEREALTDDDRALISSVFYNRLKANMPLQSDATLAYTLGREVTAVDLTQDDPYNTYTNMGLTPTPICNPGLASLAAAANPQDTGYYYFYITSSVHAFSETYEQHQQVIAQNSGA
ncbi:MAG: endolytic transglycosylase MltG [Coriobacteriaceae bacterium]|nr:endolytic transglycosylase MltG [Coriobacteriaceae bacterium]